MIFKERQTDEGFSYTVEGVFGKITLASPVQLDGATLDDTVVAVLRTGGMTGTIKDVQFWFEKASTWVAEKKL